MHEGTTCCRGPQGLVVKQVERATRPVGAGDRRGLHGQHSVCEWRACVSERVPTAGEGYMASTVPSAGEGHTACR